MCGGDLGSALARAVRRFGSRTFIEFGDRRTTYAQFNDRVDRLAQVLRSRGIRPGDRVAVLLNNRPEAVEVVFAAIRAGAIYVPLNRRLTPAELVAILQDALPTALVVESSFAGVLDRLDEVDTVSTVLLVADRVPEGAPNGTVRYEDALERCGTATTGYKPVDLSSPQAIHYTSGTTGIGKGVVRSHGANAAMALGSFARMPVGADDGWLYAIPLHSAAFYALALPVIYGGGRLVLGGAFEPEWFIRTLRSPHVTHALLVPTMWELALRAADGAPLAGPRLRHALWGGMPIAPSTAEQLANSLPVPCVGSYGLTEATCSTFSSPEVFASGRITAAGTPVDTMEVRVVDDEGQDVAPGEYGEVRLRGALVMNGYLNRPDLTSETIDGDGWLHTGDWGRLDGDGVLTVAERKKDMIITGGENVYPTEVEDVLQTLPGVREVGVVGLPDEVWGQRIAAVVVGNGISEAELTAQCQARLAGFKRPRAFVFIDELPRNSLGKLQRGDLVRLFEGHASAEDEHV
ncbi:long-chain fatty acid--CoA ligase [Rhodococcus sp. WS4]|nr:long-chain fatty acid--CoA ligase [Rhodococcus sp. WS4]